MRLLSVSRDISEAKLYEREREQMLENEQHLRLQAESVNRSKDEFLAVLSHELRTPLNAMYGWTQILETSDFDREKTQQAIKIISRNIRLQNALIEDLLDASRIISGKMRLENEIVSFVSVVQTCIDAAYPLAENRHIKIESNLDPSADEMSGDKHRLQQIVSNLLTNAIKFTPENGSVELKLENANDRARLTIKDSGIGIEPALLSFIFDRFKQADASSKRQFGGLGLGLTIVKYLVELHEGSVTAYSDGKNKGATFVVELPLAKANVTHVDFKPLKYASDSDETQLLLLEKVRILLVDDDADALNLLRFVLENQGAVIVCAASAKEALSIMEIGEFDLLISDLGMAEMDGYDLIKEVRANEKGGKIPAIALTGYVSADDREQVLQSGFQTHLPKPVDIQNLAAVARSLIK